VELMEFATQLLARNHAAWVVDARPYSAAALDRGVAQTHPQSFRDASADRCPSRPPRSTWTLEVFGNPVNRDGAIIPVHQELLMRHGIRIGESYALDEPAVGRVYEFAFVVTPQHVGGATAGNTPPAALGQPRGR